jgi:hypothetical protein
LRLRYVFVVQRNLLRLDVNYGYFRRRGRWRRLGAIARRNESYRRKANNKQAAPRRSGTSAGKRTWENDGCPQLDLASNARIERSRCIERPNEPAGPRHRNLFAPKIESLSSGKVSCGRAMRI